MNYQCERFIRLLEIMQSDEKIIFHMERVQSVRKWIRTHNVCFVASDPFTIRWMTGFTGSNGLLFLDQDQLVLITDSRYTEQGPKELMKHGTDANCLISPDPLKTVAELSESRDVFLDGEKFSWSVKKKLQNLIDGTVVDAHEFCSTMRGLKDESEIAKIKKAADITCKALDKALSEIDDSTTEKQLAAKVEYFMSLEGASNAAYPPIIASGPNSALPHARPTDQRILNNNLLLVDVGANYDGYCSDMTRVIPLSKLSEEQMKVSQKVLDAQERAIQMIRPGVTANEIDAVCRNTLSENGLAKKFTHGAGHGVGLEIHEYPRINRTSSDVIQEGMVITVEPGVYLEGSYGIRWEDLLVVTSKGVEYLTKYEKLTQVSKS